ncbi:MAG: alanine--tRNA ligase [bacterium]|nr:alanine--tRNA ligase [bacterium]
METAEIRKLFEEYFSQRGHTACASVSLIPAGDPTLLFVNAGMVPFKDTFLGTEKRGYTRATSCQKCLRISGKHNDLENVGRTARHHTFFEMLGNFSFGDYFKSEAIKYAWEFLTEVVALPKSRLWVTIFEDDDEAGKLWAELTDINPQRILKMGAKDNFWAMGETGPCGPCTEIHYFLGEDVNSQSEEDFRADNGDYLEIWNLVFMQYNRDISGALNPLPKPSVDTGMGLERIAAVKQGVLANYDTDLFRAIIACGEQLSGASYVGKSYQPSVSAEYLSDVALRVAADHARAAAFLIADGVFPASDGRGYVLRRLIRRACRHGRNLGLRKPFLFELVAKVVELYSDQYPELARERNAVIETVRREEERFLVTLDTGLSILEGEVAGSKAQGAKSLSGSVAFLLHDTYGFPLDLTEDIVSQQGLSVDVEGFQREMEQQKQRSRAARSSERDLKLRNSVKASPTEFVGYEYEDYQSEVVGIFTEEGEIAEVSAGDEFAMVVARTPFYAESGGQVGDTGTITSNSAVVEVLDTQKVGGDTIVHICRMTEGRLKQGENVRLEIDVARRKKIRAHHSATHLLHQALREVLGDHVKQAGSKVSDTSLRFDFSHPGVVSQVEIKRIEELANTAIRNNDEVVTRVMPIEEARKTGARALFGEKYGQNVRVVQIGRDSVEFCGGTHASRSGDLGLLTVVSEGSVSAGVRRIEAVTGEAAFDSLQSQREVLGALVQLTGSPEVALKERVQRMAEQIKNLEREADRAKQQLRSAAGGDLVSQAVAGRGGMKVLALQIEDADAKQLREMADDLRGRIGSGCLALASAQEGKLTLLAAVTKDLVSTFHAGELVKEMSAITGGKGGGKADLAQAGGGSPEKIDQALQKFRELCA